MAGLQKLPVRLTILIQDSSLKSKQRDKFYYSIPGNGVGRRHVRCLYTELQNVSEVMHRPEVGKPESLEPDTGSKSQKTGMPTQIFVID